MLSPALLAFTAICAMPQEPASLLDVAITGSYSIPPGTPKEENPFEDLYNPRVQRLLLQLSEEPMSPEAIEQSLEGGGITAAHLVKAGLLRKTVHGYAITFSLLTRKDQARLIQGIEPFAKSLAQAYLADRPQLEGILARSPQAKRLPGGSMAFFALGCVSLDWDGLSLVSCEGYRAHTPVTRYGRHFLWAIEINLETSTAKLYDQSTTTHELPTAAFTTFGVFPAPGEDRNAFPEAFRTIRNGVAKSGLPGLQAEAVSRALDAPLRGYFNQLGTLMLALRTPKKPDEMAAATGQQGQALEASLHLLESLGYIQRNMEAGTFEAIIPVLTQDDAAWIMDLRIRSWKIFKDWFEKNYKPLEAAFSNLSASRQGVPFPVVFDQVFHYLFGRANAHLMAAGFYPNVEAKEWKHPGFLPSVWDPRLKLGENEENPCEALKRDETKAKMTHPSEGSTQRGFD